MGKPDMFMIWHMHLRQQFDDGHWDDDFFVKLRAPALFQTQEQKDAFLAECPCLSTLVMLHSGMKNSLFLAARAKQVREVKLGDGREHADEVVV